MESPIAFAAFANDRVTGVRYLRNLNQEARQVRDRFESIAAWEFEVRQNASLDDILKVFGRVRHRIAIFHYGGHAGSYELLLESPEGAPAHIHGASFAEFLAHSRGLHLVFLNGCTTREQAIALRQCGVPAVIATDIDVDDTVAVRFADEFYGALAGGEALRDAYDIAAAAVRSARGDAPRSAYRDVMGVGESRDEWPWALHCAPGAGDWSLGHAADDPLLGLPPLPVRNLPEEPFRNLSPFGSADAPLFFGRAREIRALYDVVTEGEAPVILLHGRRGVGKTSLLEAGLLPRLESSHDIHIVRCNDDTDIVENIAAHLGCAPDPASILQAWNAIEERGRPIICVVDQLEQIIATQEPTATGSVDSDLTALAQWFVEQSGPRRKLIISLQNEWLAEVDGDLRRVGVPRTRFFVDRLDRRSIIDAVIGVAKEPRLRARYNLSVDEALPTLLADDLLEDPQGAVAPILQVLLARMWKECGSTESGQPRFSTELYLSLKKQGLALDDFIDERLARLTEWNARVVRSGLVLDILAFHTTSTGWAEQRTDAELREAYISTVEEEGLWKRLRLIVRGLRFLEPIASHRRWKDRREKREIVPQLIQRLVDLQLLVAGGDSANAAPAVRSTRLAHDVLAPLIRRRFELSAAVGQRARRIVETPREPEPRMLDRWWAALPFAGLTPLAFRVPPPVKRPPRPTEAKEPADGGAATNMVERPVHVADLAVVDRGTFGTREWTPREAALIKRTRGRRALSRIWKRVGPTAVFLVIGLMLLTVATSRDRWASRSLAQASAAYEAGTDEALLLAVEAIRRAPTIEAYDALITRLLERPGHPWFRNANPDAPIDQAPVLGTSDDAGRTMVEVSIIGAGEQDSVSIGRFEGDSTWFSQIVTFGWQPWFGPGESTMIVAALDTSGSLRFWDQHVGRLLWGPFDAYDEPFVSLRPSDDGWLLVTASNDGSTVNWEFDPYSLARLACRTVTVRRLAPETWTRLIPDREWEDTCDGELRD